MVFGQRVFTKSVEIFPIPDNGNQVYDLGIDARYAWIDTSNSYIYSQADDLTTIYPLPYVNPKIPEDSILCVIDRKSNAIQIRTGAASWSGYRAFIVIKYYK